MNISSAIQKHYRREKILAIDNSIEAVRDRFAKLATKNIVCGHFLNPFTSRYKFKFRCDGNNFDLEGPYGMKMMLLITRITFQPSMLRDCTTLNLVMQIPNKGINITLVIVAGLCALGIYATDTLFFKSIVILFFIAGLYGYSWMYFNHSSDIIVKYLSQELAAVDRRQLSHKN